MVDDRALTPTSIDDLAGMIRSTAEPLTPVGQGTKAGIGVPVAHRALRLGAFSGVTLYEPEELILSVGAATPLADIAALLEAQNQFLAFEPLMAARFASGSGTIGGLVATALSGPRRIKAGAVRDHVLGVTGVTGRGDIFKAGGRVVKNVTGFDLSKGLVGSYGTLAVLTEITLKVMPKPETELTLSLPGLGAVRAVEALCLAMGSSADVSGAAYLPAEARAVLRLEGIEPSVLARFEQLARMLSAYGRPERIEVAASARLWQAVRDVEVIDAAPGKAVWRLSVKPSAGPIIVEALGARHLVTPLVYDWSGGLVYLAVDDDGDGLGSAIRALIAAEGGGHATLMCGSERLRRMVSPLQPPAPVVAALEARLKAEFDPMNILNPGRMGR